MNAILPADTNERTLLVNLAKKRYRLSRNTFSPKHEIWTRCYKIYRALADATDDPDEVNLFIPYAFGIIEDIVSRVTEPLLQKLPIRPQARSPKFTNAARNFYALVKTYFATSRYQQEYTESNRQKAITGNAWEKDEWACDWIEGSEWVTAPVRKVVKTMGNVLGKFLPMDVETWFNKLVERPKLYAKEVGYRVQFPSVFLIWPEPGIKRVEDMHWILEEEESVALDDLRKQKYRDVDGQIKQVYDLTEIDSERGSSPPGSIQPRFDDKSPYHQQLSDVLGGRTQAGTSVVGSAEQDMDKVHLLHVYEPNRIYTIAQGKYLIKYIDKPWHKPQLHWRLKIYTPDSENLYGIGAIEPCEHMFLDLNDIHRLSMRTWIRIVNGMIAYHKDAVPFPDDWKPKAMGRIRIDPGVSPSIHNAITTIQLQDPTNTMLAHESNMKGLLERVISIADLSPGLEGTKQYHKTATGLLEIQNSLAKRFATMRRGDLANFQAQMQAMYDMCIQYMFEPVVARVDSNGLTLYPKFTRDDIWTGDEGFDFLIEEDPSFGDNVVQRSQLMTLLELGIKHETFRMNSKDPELLKLKINELMKRLIEAFGWTYSAEMLVPASSEIPPDAELQMILEGMPVHPQPKENLMNHLIEHTAQMMSPRLAEGAAAGQIEPEKLAALKLHIEETANMIQMIASDPQSAAMARVQETMQGAARTGGPPGLLPGGSEVIAPVGVGVPGGMTRVRGMG